MSGIRIERSREYSTPHGRRLSATIFRPENDDDAPHPAVLLIHGGGWIGGMRAQLNWYGKKFAERGYVAMTIDYRRMFRWVFPHCLHDAKSAVRWLRLHADELHIDEERIFALGNSAGGHLCTMLAATWPDHGLEGEENPGPSSAITAAVSLYGPSDLRYYREPYGPLLGTLEPIPSWYVSQFVDAEHGVVNDRYLAASPITYIDRRTSPIMLIQGTRDWLVPFEQTEYFHKRLMALDIPTEFHVVRNRNHAFDFVFLNLRSNYFEKICGFLERHSSAPAIEHEAASTAKAM